MMHSSSISSSLPNTEKVLFGAFCGAVVGVATVTASAAAGAAQARASDLGVSETDTRHLRQDPALLEAVQGLRQYCTKPDAASAYRSAVLLCEEVLRCYHCAQEDAQCPRHWALKVHGASSRAAGALRRTCQHQQPGSRDAVLCTEVAEGAITLLDNYVHNIMIDRM